MNKIIIEVSKTNCPKCGGRFQRRKHSKITSKMRKQPFYFTEWDYCRNCKHVQHYEIYKVWNRNKLSLYIKEKEDTIALFNNAMSKD